MSWAVFVTSIHALARQGLLASEMPSATLKSFLRIYLNQGISQGVSQGINQRISQGISQGRTASDKTARMNLVSIPAANEAAMKRSSH
jgi:hypothetical protein